MNILFDKFGLSFWCDWAQLRWKNYNWLTFNFIELNIEWDKIANEFVFVAGLLGFNIRWQRSLDKWFKTEQNKELMRRLKSIKRLIKKCPPKKRQLKV